MTVAALVTAVEELRREFQERMDALSTAISELQRTGAVSSGTAAILEKAAQVKVNPATPAPAAVVSAPREEEITVQTLAVIAAAVTAYLGKKVRIRSAKLLQTPYEIINPWAQQGRVFVQASHQLPRR